MEAVPPGTGSLSRPERRSRSPKRSWIRSATQAAATGHQQAKGWLRRIRTTTEWTLVGGSEASSACALAMRKLIR